MNDKEARRTVSQGWMKKADMALAAHGEIMPLEIWNWQSIEFHLGSMMCNPVIFLKCFALNVARLLPRSTAVAATIIL